MTQTTQTTTQTTAQTATTKLRPRRTGMQPAHGQRSKTARGRAREVVSSLRTRILAGYVGLLLLAVVSSFAVGRQVLLDDVNDRIDARLSVIADELRGISARDDPVQGESAADRVRRIFRGYLRNNLPPRDGTLLAVVEGRAFLRSRTAVPYRIDLDERLMARWAAPQRSDRGRADTPAGPIEYLAVPVRSRGQTRGVFVAVVFRDPAQAELTSAVRATGTVGIGILVLGSLLAWRLASTVLRPVRALGYTAQSITDSDLSRRIPVVGNDEVAQLATRFNAMLDRLETAFAAQRQLVDDAGHELRTPLTVIRGHLELLGENPDERRDTMALVLDEIDRMTRIVDDLLVLAKAEQPDFLRLDSVDLAALTAELGAKSTALADRAWQVEHIAQGMIIADRQRLTQAMMQLAHNAALHTPAGGEIAIGSSIDNGRARLWVRDSGAGIPPDEHERIFQRFARGSSGERLQGAGLGLAIVNAIAQAHHGTVDLISRPGAGATFTLVLPADQPVTADDVGR